MGFVNSTRGILLGAAVGALGIALQVYSLGTLKLYVIVGGWIITAYALWLSANLWRYFDGSATDRSRSNRLVAIILAGAGLYLAYVLLELWSVEKRWILPLLELSSEPLLSQ